jgi:hypothetical protein
VSAPVVVNPAILRMIDPESPLLIAYLIIIAALFLFLIPFVWDCLMITWDWCRRD